MQQTFPQPDDRGLWRFGIISPLLHRGDDCPPLHSQIEELSHRMFYAPNGRELRLSPSTLRTWLARYQQCGIDGLRNKPRKDHGTTSVTEAIADALTDLRRKHPDLTVKRLLVLLRREGLWNGKKPSRSALYRFTASHALGRCPVLPQEPVRSFEYPYFGDLWSADFLHGPKVRCAGNTARKAYLHAVIDDATRYIVAARFHLSEDTRSMLDDLMLAIRRFGIPKRLYTDNGAAFRSRHLRMVAAKLGIALPHTPAYKPRGRGKIERFFRTVRESFLAGRDKTSLDKLNADLVSWINTYHHTPHHALGMTTPLDRKLSDRGTPLLHIAPTQNINDIFRMEQIKRIGNDGCVRMFNKRFEVPDAIPGGTVVVYYMPWNTDYLLIGPDKIFVKPLDAIRNAMRFDKPQRGRNDNHNKETMQ
jgi:transposase InsO family protein